MTPKEHIQEAVSRFRQEGNRGVDWVFFHLSATERDAIDKWLVDTAHPLAMEPGTQENRFHSIVHEHVLLEIANNR